MDIEENWDKASWGRGRAAAGGAGAGQRRRRAGVCAWTTVPVTLGGAAAPSQLLQSLVNGEPADGCACVWFGRAGMSFE